MADSDFIKEKKKAHRARNSGVSADKKKARKRGEESSTKQKNPKAFAIQSVVRAEKRFRRTEDLTAKKQHIPLVDKTPEEPPPILIAVVGPPKVGKSTLIRNLVRSFTKTNVTTINGPITIVTSKKRRISLIECNNDVNCMIDIAKCADLVLLMCDASFGFEMEIFEFLNICQVHGMPKIMGVLTHLDMIKNLKTLKHRKKELKQRFWTEVYAGAKLFYLSGILHGEYLRNEISNLGRFISVMKYRPLTWRGAHSYILADRMEDITNLEEIRLNSKCDREVVLYGYIRGVPLNKELMVHIAGVGDMRIYELNALSDPCPLPSAQKKRNLLEKERLLYAPMSGVGGIVYDKDAVYIELQGSHSHKERNENPEQDELVNAFIDKKNTFDTQIENQEFKLFSDGNIIKSSDFVEEKNDSSDSDDDDDDGNSSYDDSGVEDELDDSKNKSSLGWKGESDDDDDDLESGGGDDDGASSSDEEYDNDVRQNNQQNLMNENDVDDDDNDDDDDEDEDNWRKVTENNMSWKENLTTKARDAYLERQADTQNLMKLVYGIFSARNKKLQAEKDDEDDDENELGGLFKVVNQKQTDLHKERTEKDAEESSFFEEYHGNVRDWISDEHKPLLKNCFVTGKWRASEDAEELLRLDDLSDGDSEVYGDFEDFETGEKHQNKDNNKKENDNDGGDDDDDEFDDEDEGDDEGEGEKQTNLVKSVQQVEDSRKRKASRVEDENMNKLELREKKKKLKAKFDSEYDNPDDSTRIKGDHQYYDALKAEALKQSEVNKSEFTSLDENTRVDIEGYRAGLYVRMSFQKMPCEFVDNFDSTYPVLIGGLNMAEENIGYVTCKVKKHRWFKKILKTADPVIMSLGWRRFQTIPLYSKIEDNLKHRYLKYTPNHITCSMTFYGPITPQNTGFLAIQSVAQDNSELRKLGFRIAATGCVTEMDQTTQIMKKLKLVGTPLKIYKKTAIIQGMFTSTLEVARFEGAKIKTVSGIRGQIKKAERTPEGACRATFEDKILLSDIVFCRTWFRVDVPKFYTPITSLLLPAGEKSQWQGMKTVGQLKREKNIHYAANLDSLYTEVKREEKHFKPLTIPKSLQKDLPYKDKPKKGSGKKAFDVNRVAVIRSPHEQKVSKMMSMIKTNYTNKQEKTKEINSKKLEQFRKQKESEQLRKLKRQKELKKKVFKALGKMDNKKKQK